MIVLALHLFASAASLQEGDPTELRFHRVHLRNGNFVDGQLLKETVGEVVLHLKFGDMAFRKDQIASLEFVKMRNRNEPPVVERRAPPRAGASPDAAAPSHAFDIPADLRTRVDAILARLQAAPQGARKFPVEEFRALGEDAGVYLLSRFRDLPLELQGLAATALSIVKFSKTIPLLEGLLSEREPRLRATAAVALGLMGDAEKGRYLKPLLRDPDPEVRATVLGMLNSVEDQEWLGPIGELCGDADPDVRNQALQIANRLAIHHQQQEPFLRVLTELLRHAADEIRVDVAGVVGSLGQLEGWSLLTPLLTESSAPLRAAGALALRKLGAPDSAAEILAQLPRERDRRVRIHLAGAVQRLRLRGAIRPLIDWLSDADEEVRNVAGATLGSITGQNFGVDHDQWQSWYESTGEK